MVFSISSLTCYIISSAGTLFKVLMICIEIIKLDSKAVKASVSFIVADCCSHYHTTKLISIISLF